MSDDQVPAWAKAMEHRLIVEISKELADSKARITHRLNETATTSASTWRAPIWRIPIDTDRAEVANLRREMTGLYRRLQDVEHRLFNGDPKPPEAA